jgi:ornithine cyclodeaminase
MDINATSSIENSTHTTKVVTVSDIAQIIKKHGFDPFMLDLVQYLKDDFARWDEFDKSPRHAIHVDGGVIELMPVADGKYYTYKYVNGHPRNPISGMQTVIATGQLSLVANGYPQIFSEMTTLTALRTAATAIIACDLLARQDSSTLAVIGTGAQSEFQVRSHLLVRKFTTIKYYDTDPKAMDKFARNLPGYNLVACKNAYDAILGSDVVIVCTACKGHVKVVADEWVTPGMHISGLGGDCPGKTELDIKTLYRSKIVVEYTPQSVIEGDIQLLTPDEVDKLVYAELWELITGKKAGRTTDSEVTVFDSVGFALEDYSVLRLVFDLANKYSIGQAMDLVPQIADPKNLISVLD